MLTGAHVEFVDAEGWWLFCRHGKKIESITFQWVDDQFTSSYFQMGYVKVCLRWQFAHLCHNVREDYMKLRSKYGWHTTVRQSFDTEITRKWTTGKEHVNCIANQRMFP